MNQRNHPTPHSPGDIAAYVVMYLGLSITLLVIAFILFAN